MEILRIHKAQMKKGILIKKIGVLNSRCERGAAGFEKVLTFLCVYFHFMVNQDKLFDVREGRGYELSDICGHTRGGGS